VHDSSDESERTEVTNEQRSTPSSVSRSPSTMNDVRERKSNIEDLVRVILALSTVLFVILALIIYVIVRDITVLFSTTIVGISVIAVFNYYFERKRN